MIFNHSTEGPKLQRCTGPCGRLLYASDYPRRSYGKCWDCTKGTAPANEGHDNHPNTPTRRTGRTRGF